MNRIGRAAVRAWPCLGVLFATLGAPRCEAAEPLRATASAVASDAAPRPNAGLELPHVRQPDAPLYPDYYALALARTSVTDDPAWRALRLQVGAMQGKPSFIVLPVQTQAFGFSPTFRALIGARLDQELQRRHVDATRQTDIVDWHGPFVRRLDDATIDAFAAAHQGTTLLTLTLGHDGGGHAFITVGTRKDGRTTLAHRRIDIPHGPDVIRDEIPALDLFTAAVASMLGELGLGDAKLAATIAPGGNGGCSAQAWRLDDVAATAAPDVVACHALAMGSLMPNFSALIATQTQPDTPDRAAWLARAWVEASALQDSVPAMKDAARLAAVELHLGELVMSATPLINSADPVVRPLARMLTARERMAQSPTRSLRSAVEDDIEQASKDLPPFARAIVLEHARFPDAFLEVDLCPSSLALPYFRTPAGCEDDAVDAPRATQPASRGQVALLDEWRVAAAYKNMYYEGEMQGNVAGFARVLAETPPSVSRHPLVRVMRYVTRRSERPVVGIDAYRAQALRQLTDYAQAVATLQRGDAMIRKTIVGDDVLPAALIGLQVQAVRDDLSRLDAAQAFDFWGEILFRPQFDHLSSTILEPGSYDEASTRMALAQAPPRRSAAPSVPASGVSAVRVARPPAPTVVFLGETYGALPTREQLEHALQVDPSDDALRNKLATVALEHGASVADARKIIEARTPDARTDGGIGESNAWAMAARVFLYTGELDVARTYFARAQDVGSGSDEEMHSSVRLKQMAGDLRGALAAAQGRAQRYDGESSLREETSLLFVLHRRDEAWTKLLPRLQTARAKLPWEAALVGIRLDGMPLSQVPAWLVANRLAGMIAPAAVAPTPNPVVWLQTVETLDRLPSGTDLGTHLPLPPGAGAGQGAPIPIGGGLLMRTAIAGSDRAHPLAFAADMDAVVGADRWLLQPFYAWALWNETDGKDPALDGLRKAPVGSRFPIMLARAMIQAADGQRGAALEALTAARFELARVPDVPSFGDDFDTSPYDFVLATWLMTRKTGDAVYADVGLKIARAYQRVWPWAAWTYAGEALLGTDAAARQVAACRALALDAGSMFLRESGLHPDPKSAVCRKAAAW